VSRYALESVAKLKKKEYVPVLIQKLISPITREDASSALEKYGSKIVGTLADYMGDKEEDLELRKGAVSLLASIGTQDAADFLVWELEEDRKDMDVELIDSLDKVRSEKPDIQFQETLVRAKIYKEIKRYSQDLIELYDLISTGKKEEREKILQKNLSVSFMNIFRLLALIYPHEDIIKAYQNIKTETKDSMAYAVELLDNILEKEMKDVIFPLVEDLPLKERVKRCLNLIKILLDK
jgi:HEAT repeat protein